MAGQSELFRMSLDAPNQLISEAKQQTKKNEKVIVELTSAPVGAWKSNFLPF